MESLTSELLILSKVEHTKNELVKDDMVDLHELVNEVVQILAELVF